MSKKAKDPQLFDVESEFNVISEGVGNELNHTERKPIRADNYTEAVHEFLWNPYIPLNDFSVLMAASGTGKSFFCCKLAAQISNGENLFLDDSEIEPQPANVLYISSEENGNELFTRMKKCNADTKRIFILDRKESLGMSFDNAGYSDFISQIKQCSPKLVIIDPWQAYIGSSVDVNKCNSVRPVLQNLAVMALECKCAILLISHINKKAQAENINNSAIGSSEFINAARSAMILTYSDDEDERDIRILVHSKQNYTAAGDSLKYRITEDGGIEWVGRSDVTRQVLEDAARYHKKTAEVLAEKTLKRDRESDLINAIKKELQMREELNIKKRISYSEFKERYGEDIFGNGQPTKLLTAISYKLKELGIAIDASKPVFIKRDDGTSTTAKGFDIIRIK